MGADVVGISGLVLTAAALGVGIWAAVRAHQAANTAAETLKYMKASDEKDRAALAAARLRRESLQVGLVPETVLDRSWRVTRLINKGIGSAHSVRVVLPNDTEVTRGEIAVGDTVELTRGADSLASRSQEWVLVTWHNDRDLTEPQEREFQIPWPW